MTKQERLDDLQARFKQADAQVYAAANDLLGEGHVDYADYEAKVARLVACREARDELGRELKRVAQEPEEGNRP